MTATLDRRHMLTGALGLGAATIPLPSPAAPATALDLASVSRFDLIAALGRKLEQDADELHQALEGDPIISEAAAEHGCVNARAFLVGLQLALALDIIDERLSLSRAEKLEVWKMIEGQAIRRREFVATAAARGRKSPDLRSASSSSSDCVDPGMSRCL